MMEALKRVLGDTRKVFSTRWSPSALHVPNWAINAVIYITLIRSLSYGLELFIIGDAVGVTQLAFYTSVLGIGFWGLLMLIGVVVLIIGLVLRKSIVVTIGILLCFAVWMAFGLTITYGAVMVGFGARHAIAALATAVTWGIFFKLQLSSIRRNGVES